MASTSSPAAPFAAAAERLAVAGIHKLQDLQGIDPRRLEAVTQRSYPFGACSCWVLECLLASCLRACQCFWQRVAT